MMKKDNFVSTITINGVKIYYECYNMALSSTKPVIVLLHGFLSSIFSFRKLIPLLQQDFPVLAIDLPPFGKSGKPFNFHYSYKNLAKTVIEVLSKLRYTNVIIVGHSMGGQIALNIVKQNPEIASKLILLNSSGYMKRLPAKLIYSSYLPFFHLFVKQRLKKQGVKHNLLNVVYNHSLIDDDMINGYSEPFLDNRIFVGLTKMIRHREGDLPPSDLHTIRTPVLLIWGEEDRVVPVSIGKRLHLDLSNSIFTSFQKTGHLVPEEIPKDVYQNILQFVYSS